MSTLKELEANIASLNKALSKRLPESERSKMEKLRYLYQINARLCRSFPELDKPRTKARAKSKN
jgi:hypothetical protein